MTLSAWLDKIEVEAGREQGSSATVRQKRRTVAKFLSEVIGAPPEYNERCAAVPTGQGVDYALSLCKALSNKSLRLEPVPPPPPPNQGFFL